MVDFGEKIFSLSCNQKGVVDLMAICMVCSAGAAYERKLHVIINLSLYTRSDESAQKYDCRSEKYENPDGISSKNLK